MSALLDSLSAIVGNVLLVSGPLTALGQFIYVPLSIWMLVRALRGRARMSGGAFLRLLLPILVLPTPYLLWPLPEWAVRNGLITTGGGPAGAAVFISLSFVVLGAGGLVQLAAAILAWRPFRRAAPKGTASENPVTGEGTATAP